MSTYEADRWIREVGSALRSRNITNHAAAQALHVSPATFTSWMNGATRPSVDKLASVSALTGISEWRVYDIAGYLPGSYDPATIMADAVSQQKTLYRQIQSWTERSLATTGVTTAAQIAGILLEQFPTLAVTVRQNLRGKQHKIATNTIIRAESTVGQGVVDLREQIQTRVGPTIAALGATWRYHENPFGWDPSDGVLIDVPEHERTRSAGSLPAEGLPPTIIALGAPYAHAELVGSLLAEATDYGYINSRSEACAAHELNIGTGEMRIAKLAKRRLLELCQRSHGTPTVHAFADPQMFDDGVFDAIANAHENVRFVHVSAGPELIDLGAQVWHLSPSECSLLEKQLTELSSIRSDSIIKLKMDDDEIFRNGEARHRVIDAAVAATARALDALGVLPADRLGRLQG